MEVFSVMQNKFIRSPQLLFDQGNYLKYYIKNQKAASTIYNNAVILHPSPGLKFILYSLMRSQDMANNNKDGSAQNNQEGLNYGSGRGAFNILAMKMDDATKEHKAAKLALASMYEAAMKYNPNYISIKKCLHDVVQHQRQAIKLYMNMMREFPNNSAPIRGYAQLLIDIFCDENTANFALSKADQIDIENGTKKNVTKHKHKRNSINSSKQGGNISNRKTTIAQNTNDYDSETVDSYDTDNQDSTQRSKQQKRQKYHRKSKYKQRSARNNKVKQSSKTKKETLQFRQNSSNLIKNENIKGRKSMLKFAQIAIQDAAFDGEKKGKDTHSKVKQLIQNDNSDDSSFGSVSIQVLKVKTLVLIFFGHVMLIASIVVGLVLYSVQSGDYKSRITNLNRVCDAAISVTRLSSLNLQVLAHEYYYNFNFTPNEDGKANLLLMLDDIKGRLLMHSEILEYIVANIYKLTELSYAWEIMNVPTYVFGIQGEILQTNSTELESELIEEGLQSSEGKIISQHHIESNLLRSLSLLSQMARQLSMMQNPHDNRTYHSNVAYTIFNGMSPILSACKRSMVEYWQVTYNITLQILISFFSALGGSIAIFTIFLLITYTYYIINVRNSYKSSFKQLLDVNKNKFQAAIFRLEGIMTNGNLDTNNTDGTNGEDLMMRQISTKLSIKKQTAGSRNILSMTKLMSQSKLQLIKHQTKYKQTINTNQQDLKQNMQEIDQKQMDIIPDIQQDQDEDHKNQFQPIVVLPARDADEEKQQYQQNASKEIEQMKKDELDQVGYNPEDDEYSLQSDQDEIEESDKKWKKKLKKIVKKKKHIDYESENVDDSDTNIQLDQALSQSELNDPNQNQQNNIQNLEYLLKNNNNLLDIQYLNPQQQNQQQLQQEQIQSQQPTNQAQIIFPSILASLNQPLLQQQLNSQSSNYLSSPQQSFPLNMNSSIPNLNFQNLINNKPTISLPSTQSQQQDIFQSYQIQQSNNNNFELNQGIQNNLFQQVSSQLQQPQIQGQQLQAPQQQIQNFLQQYQQNQQLQQIDQFESSSHIQSLAQLQMLSNKNQNINQSMPLDELIDEERKKHLKEKRDYLIKQVKDAEKRLKKGWEDAADMDFNQDIKKDDDSEDEEDEDFLLRKEASMRIWNPFQGGIMKANETNSNGYARFVIIDRVWEKKLEKEV